MKFRKARLEFGVTCLADSRVLYQVWDRFWTLEAGRPNESILLYVTVEDRLPGEQVNLNFQASPGVLDKFLAILDQDGLKFSCDELVPGFLTTCRVVKERGGVRLIGGSGGNEPGSGQNS